MTFALLDYSPSRSLASGLREQFTESQSSGEEEESHVLKIWEIPLGRFERRLRLTPGVTLTIGDTRFADGLFIAQINKSL
jgi:hypothetical protein